VLIFLLDFTEKNNYVRCGYQLFANQNNSIVRWL